MVSSSNNNISDNGEQQLQEVQIVWSRRAVGSAEKPDGAWVTMTLDNAKATAVVRELGCFAQALAGATEVERKPLPEAFPEVLNGPVSDLELESVREEADLALQNVAKSALETVERLQQENLDLHKRLWKEAGEDGDTTINNVHNEISIGEIRDSTELTPTLLHSSSHVYESLGGAAASASRSVSKETDSGLQRQGRGLDRFPTVNDIGLKQEDIPRQVSEEAEVSIENIGGWVKQNKRFSAEPGVADESWVQTILLPEPSPIPTPRESVPPSRSPSTWSSKKASVLQPPIKTSPQKNIEFEETTREESSDRVPAASPLTPQQIASTDNDQRVTVAVSPPVDSVTGVPLSSRQMYEKLEEERRRVREQRESDRKREFYMQDLQAERLQQAARSIGRGQPAIASPTPSYRSTRTPISIKMPDGTQISRRPSAPSVASMRSNGFSATKAIEAMRQKYQIPPSPRRTPAKHRVEVSIRGAEARSVTAASRSPSMSISNAVHIRPDPPRFGL